MLSQHDSPIWSALAVIEDLTNEIEVLVFFVRCSHFSIESKRRTTSKKSRVVGDLEAEVG